MIDVDMDKKARVLWYIFFTLYSQQEHKAPCCKKKVKPVLSSSNKILCGHSCVPLFVHGTSFLGQRVLYPKMSEIDSYS